MPQGPQPRQGHRRNQEDDGGAAGLNDSLQGFSADAVRQIRARLDLARLDGARILFAIESGSRAWGFPSPDSDYDCRFVYIRSLSEHLVLGPQRDVIEFPIEGEIDASGWDLRKALLLALKGNAVIVEWTKSAHVYEETPGFRSELLGLIDRIIEPEFVARHYVGLLTRHSGFLSSDEVPLKKLFYALRPALSLHYMAERQFRALPPMDMGSLLAGVTLDGGLLDIIDELTEAKRLTREMGTGPVPSPLADYLQKAKARHAVDGRAEENRAEAGERYRVAEDFYRRTILEYGGRAELSLD